MGFSGHALSLGSMSAMPYPDDLRTNLPGSPYADTPEDAASYDDFVRIEEFMVRLQEVHAEGVAMMDDLNYGMKYLGLQDALKDIPAMIDSIQDDINDSLITE